MKKLMSILWPTCREASELYSKRLDGALPWWRVPGLWLRLKMCKPTRTHADQLKLVNDMVACVDQKIASGDCGGEFKLSDDACERMREKLRKEQ